MDYEERKAAREAEFEGLWQALSILAMFGNLEGLTGDIDAVLAAVWEAWGRTSCPGG